MKKSILIIGVSAFLVLLLLVLVALLITRNEEPKYLTLDIPMPQHLPTYEGEYADSEEFSTFVTNDLGQHLHYFVYRMYVPVHLGEQGFENRQDVENYYNGWMKKLGWKEERSTLCNYAMREFQPQGSYQAYMYPTKSYPNPVACLATWLESDEYLYVLIKTVNPSSDVLKTSD